MKLGTQTGSLINHVQSVSNQLIPEVGMGATILGWSDRTPATVTNVFVKGKFTYFVVQEDSYTRVDDNGMSELQTYEFSPNPEGFEYTFRVTDNGYQGVYLNENKRYVNVENFIRLGKRERYYDYSF